MTERTGWELRADPRWQHGAVPAAIILAAAAVVATQAGPEAVLAQAGTALGVSGLILVCAAPAAILALSRHRWRGAWALAIVGALLTFNLLSLTLPRIGPFAGLDWNWQGKTLDLVWCLAVIALLSRDQRLEIGWTWRTRPGTLPMAFTNIGIMALVGFMLMAGGALGPDGGLTLERVLFDTTHPNLVEEIVFRGFMLALLDRAFPPAWAVSGARIGWGTVLCAWLFGLVHGVVPGPDGGIAFDPLWLVVTFVTGLVIGWIRALTGALWPAFLAHAAPEIGILFALALV